VATIFASPAQVIDMPGLRPIAKHLLTALLIVSLLPMAVFYTTMSMFGLRAAALVTVTVYYGGLLVKVVRHKPILAAALLTAGLLSIRTAVMFLNGSAFVYFVQPVAGTLGLATAIAATALAGRPILDRLAHEFCPFPDELSARLRKSQFFTRLSIVWATTYVINAVGTVWLLSTMSVSGFVVFKSLLGPTLTTGAVVASLLYFRIAMRNQNVCIRWDRGASALGRLTP
jgi:hypothetical protein